MSLITQTTRRNVVGISNNSIHAIHELFGAGIEHSLSVFIHTEKITEEAGIIRSYQALSKCHHIIIETIQGIGNDTRCGCDIVFAGYIVARANAFLLISLCIGTVNSRPITIIVNRNTGCVIFVHKRSLIAFHSC